MKIKFETECGVCFGTIFGETYRTWDNEKEESVILEGQRCKVDLDQNSLDIIKRMFGNNFVGIITANVRQRVINVHVRQRLPFDDSTHNGQFYYDKI